MKSFAILSVSCFLVLTKSSPINTNDTTTTISQEDAIRHDKAQEILRYMNTSADPCEDFYEFACGNYGKYNRPSYDKPHTGLLPSLQNRMNEKLKSLLLAEISANDTEVDRQAKTFYKSCLNIVDQKHNYPVKLREIAKEFGQMPMLMEEEEDKWDEDKFDWLETVGNISHKLGIAILFDFGVAIDFTNNSINRLYITQQEFPVPKAIYLDAEHKLLRKAYGSSIRTKLREYLNVSPKVASQTAEEIVYFEIMLTEKIMDTQDNKGMSDLFKLSRFEEANTQYASQIDIKQQALRVFGTIPSHLQVYIQYEYFNHLLQTITKVPKRIVANYIFYQLLSHFIFEVDAFEEKRQNECLVTMKKHFFRNLDNMFYRQQLSKETEDAIGDVWQLHKSAYQQSLEGQEFNWINEDTRKYALEKLQAMTMEILSYENHNFTKTHGSLNFHSDNYIDNVRQLLMRKASLERAKLYEPPQALEFGETLSLTPVNLLLENTVKIPVAFLQPHTTWSSNYPNAYNFALLGAVLAHELLHGFDNTGRTYDLKGNNRVWWDPQSRLQFDDRSKCLQNQYRNYSFNGHQLTDMENQGENIADNGGVRLAYRAYLNWFAQSDDDRKIQLESFPGLNYTNRQLFFISYGQVWCSTILKEYQSVLASTDSHVPENFRVIGPLSNFEEFSQEFKCPPGSGMNPEKKCKIY
ncbi:membrane metallo-endopeptidase-like 1 [Haematobia irritans]|uniref:membrane metallo-endopeptidase-like 1 n=1 Tax=Haematobia irritans TaxID=7368 RepID=UPI003F4F8D79